ncbi:MAG: serine hydrolase [Bacteroidota bacterium]|nr:serine hydrolase [Bacteroidota bacterium]
MKKINLFFITISFLVLLSSCKKKDLGISSNQKVFSIPLFRQSLMNQLNGSVGYTIVINQNGKLVDTASSGISFINPSGGGFTPVSIYHDICIASVTKPITAMAAIKLLEQKGILLDFPIGSWLPNRWQKSKDISEVTFRQLLTHTSGIRQSNPDWDTLKTMVSMPITNSKDYAYANANFGLFRLLIPKLNDASDFNVQEQSMGNSQFSTWVSLKYIQLMHELVFSPAMISDVRCNIDPNKPNMQAFNESNNLNFTPVSFGDLTERSGSGGFYLTPVEMAQLMAFLVHTSSILSVSQKEKMDDGLLGWDPDDSYETSYGRVYGKDGLFYRDFDSNGEVSLGDAGLQTWVGKFPNKVELVITVNSIGSSARSLSNISRTAYLNAWVNK